MPWILHRNMGCPHLGVTHRSITEHSRYAPQLGGWCARTYLVPQAWICSCLEEQRHCPHVATQDGCMESRGPILGNASGGVCTMHEKKRKRQWNTKSRPTSEKEVRWKRLGHQQHRVWFRVLAAWCDVKEEILNALIKNESQVHSTTAVFPFNNHPCQ